VGRHKKAKPLTPSVVTSDTAGGDSLKVQPSKEATPKVEPEPKVESLYRVYYEDRFELVSAFSLKHATSEAFAAIGREPRVKKIEKL